MNGTLLTAWRDLLVQGSADQNLVRTFKLSTSSMNDIQSHIRSLSYTNKYKDTALIDVRLLRDAFNLLKGLDGEFVQVQGDSCHVPDQIPQSYRSILMHFGEYSRLRSIIKKHLSSHLKSGIIMQTLITIMEKELRCLDSDILILELEMLDGTFPISKDIPLPFYPLKDLSLTRKLLCLHHQVEQRGYMMMLKFFVIYLESLSDKRGGEILSTIYHLGQHGDQRIQYLSNHFLDHLWIVYGQMIERYVKYGEPQDLYDEFYISTRQKQSEDKENYFPANALVFSRNMQMCPVFIPLTLAQSIFKIGQFNYFLRIYHRDSRRIKAISSTLNDSEKQFTSFKNNPWTMNADLTLSRHPDELQQQIAPLMYLAHVSLFDDLFDQWHVMWHVYVMKDIVFLCNQNISDEIIHLVMDESHQQKGPRPQFRHPQGHVRPKTTFFSLSLLNRRLEADILRSQFCQEMRHNYWYYFLGKRDTETTESFPSENQADREEMPFIPDTVHFNAISIGRMDDSEKSDSKNKTDTKTEILHDHRRSLKEIDNLFLSYESLHGEYGSMSEAMTSLFFTTHYLSLTKRVALMMFRLRWLEYQLRNVQRETGFRRDLGKRDIAMETSDRLVKKEWRRMMSVMRVFCEEINGEYEAYRRNVNDLRSKRRKTTLDSERVEVLSVMDEWMDKSQGYMENTVKRLFLSEQQEEAFKTLCTYLESVDHLVYLTSLDKHEREHLMSVANQDLDNAWRQFCLECERHCVDERQRDTWRDVFRYQTSA